MTLRQLCERLKAIADKNGDSFEGKIEFSPMSGRYSGVDSIVFVEDAEGHGFFSTAFAKSNLDREVTATEEGLRDACKHWGYKYPKP